eukprot:1343083-Pleurochrysis_carterae.AAC.1
MPELLTHFTNCQAYDPHAQAIHHNAHRYQWDSAAMKLLFKGKFADIDWVNAPSGVLALKEHTSGIPYTAVNSDEIYTLPSALDELANFGAATFTAIGYSPSPAS